MLKALFAIAGLVIGAGVTAGSLLLVGKRAAAESKPEPKEGAKK